MSLLSGHAADDRFDLEGLASADVTAFVVAQARLRSVGSMRAMLSPLRCLLRFLFIVGIVPRDLTAAVPSVASPRLAALPRALMRRQSRRCWKAATGAPRWAGVTSRS
ncbi:MAG: hypothetical protein ACRDRX_08280 [Pseudonocardiaceae bacterium]